MDEDVTLTHSLNPTHMAGGPSWVGLTFTLEIPNNYEWSFEKKSDIAGIGTMTRTERLDVSEIDKKLVAAIVPVSIGAFSPDDEITDEMRARYPVKRRTKTKIIPRMSR